MAKNLLNPSEKVLSEDVWIPTVCYECNMGICMIRVHRVNGVVVGLEPNTEGENFAELAQNKGHVCPKSFGNIQKLYNPYRIKTPMKRTNPEKGRGIDPKWVEIGWDEAFNTVADKLKKVLDDNPRKFVDIGPGRKVSINGTWECFRQVLGPTNNLRSGGGVHCRDADHIFGVYWHRAFTCEPDYSYCNYLLLLGYNVMATGGAPLNHLLAKARQRGIKMVVVDPFLSVTAAKADEWIPIKPLTDTAFILALIHVILYEIGIVDEEFLKDMTNSPYLVGPDGYFIRDKNTTKPLIWDWVEGKPKSYDDETIKDYALEGSYKIDGLEGKPSFQVLKDHVRPYTPEWASAITEISSQTIRRIAKELVDHAKIGSTIQIDGVKFPYRPVAFSLGRGVSGGIHGQYQAFLASHILAILLGCLETVGGHKGGTTHPGGRFARTGESQPGIKPDKDGMLKMDAFSFTWPPISSDGKETLFPYGINCEVRATHLSYINYLDPPKGIPSPPAPEMAIAFRANPFVSLGDPQLVGEVIKKIPFVVAISYVENEVTELADIVLPDHTDLERYELGQQSRARTLFSGIALRQPAVEPLYQTMDISDILTELADRAGFLAKYNEAINTGLGMGLSDPYKLEPDRKYPWVEIVDRWCKSETDEKCDLAWFKKNGALFIPPPEHKHYDVHQQMRAEKCRYQLPYVEHVKKTGEEFKKNLERVGLDWWSTEQYQPLPTYFPNIIEKLPKEYDFYVTRCNAMQFYRATNVTLPWLLEVAEQITGMGRIIMNANVAKSRGINDGDEIWVKSPENKMKGKVKLIQGIRPDTLLILASFGHWLTPVVKDKGWVSLISLIPLSYQYTDPMTGSMQAQTIKAKIDKV